MNKKVFVAALVLLVGLSTTAWAYDISAVAPTGQTLYYNIVGEGVVAVTYPNVNPGEYYVNAYEGFTEPSGALEIPGSINDANGDSYTVTVIGLCAFINCEGLTSVIIPNTVTTIGDNAFSNCTALVTIDIPESVTIISNQVFYGCTGLVSVTLPNDLTSLGTATFYNCTGLVKASIGDSLTTIPAYTFLGCSSLDTLIIGSGITSYGDYSVYGLSVSYLSYNSPIIANSGLFNSGVVTLVIGDSVKTALPGNIGNCTNLAHLVIGNGITSIYDYAFMYKTNLLSVTIGNSVASIGVSAFNGCTGLTSVVLPNSVTTIGGDVFKNCSGLTSLTLSEGLTEISDYAFTGCSSLTSAIIPEGVTYVGNGAFENCSSMTSVTIPASAINIGFGAFSGTNLSETHYMGNAAQWLGITFYNDYANPIRYSKNLYFGDTLVTHLHIPEGVTYINNNYRNDTALTHIYIPSTTLGIEGEAFNGCAPQWFHFYAAVPPVLNSSSAFLYTTDEGQTYGSWMMVPWQSLDAYKTANNYTTFAMYLLYPDSCQLTVNVNDPTRGTVTLDGGATLTNLYGLLDTATLVASVSDPAHCQVQLQSEGCTNISSEGTSTVTYKVRFNISNAYPTVQVNFIPDTHHVNVVANNANFGTVTGTDDYGYGDLVTVEATAGDGYYFVRWADGSTDNPATFTCTGDTTVTAIFSYDVTPELCMVSVQDDRNVLLWDAEELPIANYTIYRESSVSGEYEAIATIPYAEAGSFVDNDSRPASRSYRYYMTATDAYGIESQPGTTHKTMHLTISQGIGNTWNLLWTEYEGADYTTYIIYRGTDASNIQQIDIMPSGGNTSYSDNNAPDGAVYYQVGVMMVTPCNNSAKTATISRSNIANSEGGSDPQEGIGNIDGSGIRVFARDGRIVVDGANGETVRVFDLVGRLMAPFTSSISPFTLSAGVYMVKVGNLPARKVVVIR